MAPLISLETLIAISNEGFWFMNYAYLCTEAPVLLAERSK